MIFSLKLKINFKKDKMNYQMLKNLNEDYVEFMEEEEELKKDKEHAQLKDEFKDSNKDEKGDQYGKIVDDLKGLGIIK